MMHIWLGAIKASIIIFKTARTSSFTVNIDRRKDEARSNRASFRNLSDHRGENSKIMRSLPTFFNRTVQVGEKGGSIDRSVIALFTESSYYSIYG